MSITDIDQAWEREALPVIADYIAIPARSPLFDADWEAHGHIGRAAAMLSDWARSRQLPGLTVEVVTLAGLTPVILCELPATKRELGAATVLMYGHMDKQPEMLPWSSGLAPWTPVRSGDKLYGRGGADDGYAIFAALLSLEEVHRRGGDHGRIVVLIEGSEESGSAHLEAYVEHLAPRLGSPDLVVCLDSFCETYDRLWTTTGLRGVMSGVIDVHVADSSPHSGRASGVLPSAVRILRELLDRVEDSTTGRVIVAEAHSDIPPHRRDEAFAAARAFPALADSFQPVGGVRPMHAGAGEQLLAGTWMPAMEIIGLDGIPSIADGGNVFRSRVSVKMSMRLPPNVDAHSALDAVARAITTDPPSGAHVTFEKASLANGWDAPAFSPWLSAAMNEASVRHFGQGSVSCGVGGTIPFMGMLGARFPDAQFVVIGVLGPDSNAHGPDEFLHIPTAKRITACVADILVAHARESASDGSVARP